METDKIDNSARVTLVNSSTFRPPGLCLNLQNVLVSYETIASDSFAYMKIFSIKSNDLFRDIDPLPIFQLVHR